LLVFLQNTEAFEYSGEAETDTREKLATRR
jgi:hypothetical protein